MHTLTCAQPFCVRTVQALQLGQTEHTLNRLIQLMQTLTCTQPHFARPDQAA